MMTQKWANARILALTLLILTLPHLGACASPSTLLPVKEAPFRVEDWQIYWLDDTHVLFRGFTGTEQIQRRLFVETHPIDEGTYVWNIETSAVERDVRFDRADLLCIQGPYLTYYAPVDEQGRMKGIALKEGHPIKLSEENWFNPTSCRVLSSKPVWLAEGRKRRPLLDEHGYLDFGLAGPEGAQQNPQVVFYPANGMEPISLGLRSPEIYNIPTYLPFSDAYLLWGERHNPELVPMWLLRPAGMLEQIFSPAGKPWAKLAWSDFRLTKVGLFLASMRYRGDGDLGEAGGYLVRNDVPVLVVRGVPERIAVSPDGCKIALINNKYEKHFPTAERFRLQVVNVCQGVSHVD